VESAEAATRRREMEAMKAKKKTNKQNTPLGKETSLSEQESIIRDKLSGVGQLLKDGNVMLKDSKSTRMTRQH